MEKRFFVFSLLIVLLCNKTTFAQVAPDDIKSKIDQKTEQIKKLEEEINQYNIEVNNANSQAKSLQSTIKTLDLTKKKISKDINLTESKIDKTNLNIKQISNNIDDIKSRIDTSKMAVTKAFQRTKILDDNNLATLILGQKNFSDIWKEIDNSKTVSDEIRDKIKELSILRADMEKKQDDLNNQKKSLVSLKSDLGGKKLAIVYATQEKTQILAETKSKEQIFRSLVKEKEDQKAQFEQELYEFESQLNISIDRQGYPLPKNGILSWPLDNVLVTQKFGKTIGAERLYKSGSHNGVDFRASIGTKVKNVLSGVVVGTGNTDLQKGCYSFGKWVMVKHNNGLSTIYGHLSVISVTQGQNLATGDLIGFSGNTGYSTGPHLHISVYATQGVRIEKYVNSNGCKNVVLPLADVKAYLDPLSYFPKL